MRAPAAIVALALAAVVACGSDPHGSPSTSASDAGAGTEGGIDAGRPGLPEGGMPMPEAGPVESGPAPTPVTVNDGPTSIVLTNGIVTITIDKQSGLASYAWGGVTPVTGAYASVDLGAPTGYQTSASYPSHVLAASAVTNVADGFGTGKRVPIDNTAPNLPTIEQIYSLYEGKPYFLVDEHVIALSSAPISSNYLGAIIVDARGSVTPGPGPDPRILDVPYDNDEWVRYDSRVLGATEFTGTGYEVAAVYESTSRSGLVVGSVTHDFWKTGIYYDAAASRLKGMNVWGGAATPDTTNASGPTYGHDGTHDVAKHGKMTGTTLTSPTIFVGWYPDWRDGLTAFGAANAVVKPPLAWAAGPPFGWNSYGALGSKGLTAAEITQASDFLAQNLQSKGFADQGVVYVNIDAGLQTDPTPVVQHIHANGQKAGTYRTPFSYWGTDLTVVASGSYTYGDLVLRDDAGNPIKRPVGSAYVLDPTHPGTKALIKAEMQGAVNAGFDFVKLDFVTGGAMEGKHYDPAIATGTQAYNQAMATIDALLGPNVFIDLSIAPIFPAGYAQARRISSDCTGQLNDLMSPGYRYFGSIEYMLNSVTYGFWLSGPAYKYNDPDLMALYQYAGQGNSYPEAWAASHVIASAISGSVFLDSTDYTNATAAGYATSLLTHAAIDAIAASGASFRPLDGNTGRVSAATGTAGVVWAGSAAADTFVSLGGGHASVAVFNYDASSSATRSVDLGRVGLDASKAYTVTDLETGKALGAAKGTWAVTLPAGRARLVDFAP